MGLVFSIKRTKQKKIKAHAWHVQLSYLVYFQLKEMVTIFFSFLKKKKKLKLAISEL
jgi:hypothetical protein